MLMELKQHRKYTLLNKTQDLIICSLVTNSYYSMLTVLKVSWSNKKGKELILLV